jgi:hypothetical protein
MYKGLDVLARGSLTTADGNIYNVLFADTPDQPGNAELLYYVPADVTSKCGSRSSQMNDKHTNFVLSALDTHLNLAFQPLDPTYYCSLSL